MVFKDKKEEEKDVVELDTVIPNPKEGEVASIFEEALIPDETGTKTDTKKKEEGPEAGFVDTTKQKETIVEEDNIDDEDAYAQVEEAFSDKIDETDPFRISKETIRQEFKPRFKELDDTFLPQIEQIVKEKGGKSSEAIAIRDQYNSARRTLLGQQTKAIAEAATKIRRVGQNLKHQEVKNIRLSNMILRKTKGFKN